MTDEQMPDEITLPRHVMWAELCRLRKRLKRAYELARIFEKKIAFLALSEKSHDEYSEALKELAEAEREAAVEKAPPPPSVEWSRNHLAHVQRFLIEMYQTMVDPVEEFRGNVEQLCTLLLRRAREDRQLLHDRPAEKAPEAK